MTAQNPNAQMPEPIFPELVPLVQDKPEDYDPDTQDNTGHFPTDHEEQREGTDVGYDTMSRIKIMQNVFQMSVSEMIAGPKTNLPTDEVSEDDGRDAEDKSLHKGSWGKHKNNAQLEEIEPTQEQLDNAKKIAEQGWEQ